MALRILSDSYEKLKLPSAKTVELDLGCGKGIFAVELAKKYPDNLVLGADIMLGRLRKANNKAKHLQLDNVDFLRVEAWCLVARLLPPRSIARAHIICPDPWPKKKHKGHRLMSSELISRLAEAIRPGGTLHFATDAPNYLATTVALIEKSGFFSPQNNALIADVNDMKTEFERLWERLDKRTEHMAWKRLDSNML